MGRKTKTLLVQGDLCRRLCEASEQYGGSPGRLMQIFAVQALDRLDRLEAEAVDAAGRGDEARYEAVRNRIYGMVGHHLDERS